MFTWTCAGRSHAEQTRTQSYTERRRGTHARRHVLLVLTSTLGLSGWRDEPVNHQITESLLAAGSLRRPKDSYKSKVKINLSYPSDGWRAVERSECSERERRQSGLQRVFSLFVCLFGCLEIFYSVLHLPHAANDKSSGFPFFQVWLNVTACNKFLVWVSSPTVQLPK